MGKIVLKKNPIESQVALGDLALNDPGNPPPSPREGFI